mgnify:CR=1 FL=1|jgi:N5-(cytidine 5'-diphosphoramidyl)-L-glutamine hydrolase
MEKKRLKIGISLRIVSAENYDEKRDALSKDWPQFFEKLNMTLVLIPNFLTNLESYLDSIEIDGIILSGGDNVGDFPERDSTETTLLQYGIIHDLPIFGVCRGMQMINHFFNGTIIKNLSEEHVGKPHEIKISNTRISHKFESESFSVNSFHNNIIQDKNLGKNLVSFAKTISDNTVEGIFHKEYKILGVMWHPEREQNTKNKLILKQIFSDNDFWCNLI